MKDEVARSAERSDRVIGLAAPAAFFVLWSLRATVLYFIDESISSDLWRTTYSSAVKAALWLGPAFAYVWWIRRAPALNYLGVSAKASAREWGVAAGATLLFLGAVVTFEVLLGGKTVQISSPAAFALLFLAISALIEELLFRGLVLHELSRDFQHVTANVITALLFAGVHWPYWLWSRGLGVGLIADSVGVFLASLLFGWIYLRTRSIWPCYVAHVANNVVAGFLVATSS